MISIVGATGHTGKVVADRLLNRNEAVRVIGRSQGKLQPFVARGAQAAAGDVADQAFLTDAFRGADAVYAMMPPDYHEPDYFGRYERVGTALARAIQASGVRHVVFLSSIGADQPSGTGPIVGLYRMEAKLAQIPNVNVILLRPGAFYENHFGSLGMIKHLGINGNVTGPDVVVPMTATHDVGVAAADLLQQMTASGAPAGVTVRELQGPRDLTYVETTRIIAERIGRPEVKYVQLSDADMLGGLQQAGFPAPIASLFIEMGHGFTSGLIRPLEPRRAESTGSTTFESFAEVLAGAYRAM
jgi:uncharacterized protein YbjT (DUF2867 family)